MRKSKFTEELIAMAPRPRRVRTPVPSRISKRDCRHSCQDVGPWNVRLAKAVPAESPDAPREAIAGKDARQLPRELLTMTQEEFSAAFKGSPMTRAMPRGRKRNAAVVLDNVGTLDDVPALAAALPSDAMLVRRHAA